MQFAILVSIYPKYRFYCFARLFSSHFESCWIRFLAPDSMKFQALKHPSMLSLLHQHPNGYKLFIVCRLFQLEPQTLIKVEMTKFYRGFFVFWKKECFTHMCRKPIVLIFPAFLFLKSPDSSRQCHLAFAAAQFAQHFSSGKEKNFSDMRQWLAWEQ